MITQKGVSAECVKAEKLDGIQLAWEVSRPNDQGASLEKILSVDVPVNEFARFQFEVTVPIMLREWIVSFRDHCVWARTSRVEDLRNWEILEGCCRTFQQEAALHKLHERMTGDKAAGVNQDAFRAHLPLAYMTTMSMSLSFRAAVKMINAADKEALLAGSESVTGVMFNQLAFQMDRELKWHIGKDAVGAYQVAAAKYSIDDPLSSMEPLERSSRAQVGGFVVVALKGVPLLLRTQLIRHRPLMVQDTFRSLLNDESMVLPVSTPIDLTFAASLNVAKSIVRKRNCWIAQEDLWQPVTDAINAVIGEQPALPCDDGECPFERDNRLRLLNKDPAPPCPKFANLYNEKLSEDHAAAALDYSHKHKPVTTNFWLKELTNA